MTVRGPYARGPSVEGSPRARGRSAWEEREPCCPEGEWDEAASLSWMMQASGLGHWRHELETGRFSCSDGLKAILGLDPDHELTSFEELKAILDPEERSLMEDERERAMSATDEFESEHRFVTRGGQVRWVMTRGRVGRCPNVGVVLAGIAIDITAQKEAEAERERLIAELAAERARLRALVAHIPAAVIVSDAAGRVVLANPAVESVFPFPHPTLPMKTQELLEAWHPRHPDGRAVELYERPLSRALRGETVDSEDFRYVGPDGTESWIRISSAPIRSAEDAVTGAVAIATCVDREKRADEALRSSERRHRELFDSPVIGVIYSLVDGRITDANDMFLETFGYTRQDLAEGLLSWRRLTPPEYREKDDREIEALLTTGSHGVYEKEYVRKDGTRVPIVLGGKMMQGSSTEIATFVLDISARKRVEAERESLLRSLALSEERYRLAALATDDTIYDLDLKTDSVSHQTMFGHSRDAVACAGSWADLIHPEDREAVVTSLRAALESSSRHWESEYRFRAVNGEWLVVANRGYVVFDGEGDPVRLVGAMQDVTDRRRRQEFERQLIGIVSHDLRNPLATILLAAQMMARSDGLDARTMKHAMRVQNAAERAVRMVRDLLDFTRARLGVGIAIERRPIDLAVVLQTLVDELRVSHSSRRILFESSGDCAGEFDADRLIQVVTNLLENALKYSLEGSAVRVKLVGESDEVRLVVHNLGPVIPAEVLPRIFEPLQRGNPTFDSASRSVGLGLYIVKHLVEAHGGRIHVDSSEADGTTFRLDLPRSGS